MLLVVLKRRLKEYPTTIQVRFLSFVFHQNAHFEPPIQEDQNLLSTLETLPKNKRNAVIVRYGEKNILDRIIKQLEDAMRRAQLEDKPGKNKKRSREDREDVEGRNMKMAKR